MHELAITQSILDLVITHAEREQATRILEVHLIVGELNGVVPESMEFYFEHLSKGTIADGARLVFEMVQVTALCRSCNEQAPLSKNDWKCPFCGALGLKLIAGEELSVRCIEVE
jgi:hydrogenase nickel incorporation protein HypA/HybF